MSNVLSLWNPQQKELHETWHDLTIRVMGRKTQGFFCVAKMSDGELCAAAAGTLRENLHEAREAIDMAIEEIYYPSAWEVMRFEPTVLRLTK